MRPNDLTLRKRQSGLTLVEMLVALSLMGFVLLSIGNMLFGVNLRSGSLNGRFKLVTEVQMLVNDIQEDLHRGAYLSPNSFRNRLEYTTYDPSTGDPVKKVYGICYYSTVQTASTDTTCPLQGAGGTFPYLKRSDDNGVTWGSPYRIAGFNKYRLTNASGPKFLFAHAANDCMDYVDDNGNGVLGSGDSTQNQVSCPLNGNTWTSWFATTSSSFNPTYSSKVILNNFNFTTGTGRPETTRNLPQYVFMAVNPGLVRSNASAVSPGVKDTQLIQSFSFDSTVNSLWPSGFSVGGLSWDAAHERLLIASTTHRLFFGTERNGVFINRPFTFYSDSVIPHAIAVEEDGHTLHTVGNGAIQYYYRYDLNSPLPLSLVQGPLNSISVQANPRHLAYDPNTQNLYVPCTDSGGNRVIKELAGKNSATPGTETGTTYSLPAAFSSSAQLGGLVVEPLTGDFLIARNQVYTSSSNNYIDIYRITRSGTVTSFAVNLTDLGSTATGTSGGFGMAYDSTLNRLFLADNVSKRIYEVAPVKIISSRT